MNIKDIPTSELKEDLKDSILDAYTCWVAHDRGIIATSDGSIITERLRDNIGFIRVISAELKERNEDIF